MTYLHLVSLSVLGIALLWSLKLVYGHRQTASDDVLVLVSTIAAWVLIFLGLAFISNPPVMVAGLIIAAMVVSQYRDSERRALLWTLAIAADNGVSLATAARSFAAGRIDEIGRRSARLAELLEAGVALPLALDRSDNPLPADAALAANLGYATDSLAQTLRDAAREGDRLNTVTHTYYTSLLYFVLVSNFLLAVVSFLCIKVAPTYQMILADFSMDPPSITRFVLGCANFAADYGLVLAPLLLLVNAALVYALLGYMGMRLPELGILARWLGGRDTPVILRSLGNCVTQGKTMTEGVELLAQWYPTRRVAKRLSRAADQIRKGTHWCDSLVQQKLLRPAEAAVLKSAGRVNNLEWALRETSEITARRALDRATSVSRVISPLMVLVLGIAIAVFALAFITPLAQLIAELSQ